MSGIGFAYPPSPHILQWLAAGQLANRFHRSLRLWVLLHRFYGLESPWRESLPQPFSYPEVRVLLFAPTHPINDKLSVDEVACGDPTCICHKSWLDLVFASDSNQCQSQWRPALMQMTGLNSELLEQKLQECPFATVHRSIRDDLKQLCQLGWLQSVSSGEYRYSPTSQWPTPPAEIAPTVSLAQLSGTQIWELLRVLESIAFVQPDLELVVRALWEQVSQSDVSASSSKLATQPTQRIFIHLDYILSENVQERVDTYQEQLESLWRRHEGGVVQFKYLLAAQERQVLVSAYPVCLHYMRRAKYLTAYGVDPQGKFGWHNYRLDRIISHKLKILAWGDPNLPKLLKDLWREGQLPTPQEVQTKLDEAWGFDFYLPPELLILRFPAKFARWYVDDTLRHPTFKPISHHKLPHLIRQRIKEPQQQQQLLQIVHQKSASDAYYQGFIRTGDINVLMRLRDWRPNGEVIAPLSIRLLLQKEAELELSNYQSSFKSK